MGAPVCETLVQQPVDAPPIRSPQNVHSLIAKTVRGKDIIEIGTRNGDGISCFSRFAKSTTAIVYAKVYCRSLRSRSKLLASTPGGGQG